MFDDKIFEKVHYYADFSRRKSFARARIRTHYLPTQVIFAGHYLPYRDLHCSK